MGIFKQAASIGSHLLPKQCTDRYHRQLILKHDYILLLLLVRILFITARSHL